MKITWYNGDELCGTQNLDDEGLRLIDDNGHKFRQFVPVGFGLAKFLFTSWVITMMTKGKHLEVTQDHPWHEVLCHEWRHVFYEDRSPTHSLPHTPRNTDTDGYVLRTPRIAGYFEDVDKMAEVGVMIEELFLTGDKENLRVSDQ